MKKVHLFLIIAFLFCQTTQAQSSFVTAKENQLMLNNKPYYFVGANYWYGGLLALRSDPKKGKKRLLEELDFLHAKGINNLRILAGGEGTGKINGVNRVVPSLQTEQGKFNDTILQRLDYLLYEMAKRKMKAVIFLSNNWEWSGGFLQYLNWNGYLPDSILRRKLTYEENREYVSKFYDSKPCKNAYFKQVKLIVGRRNSITHKLYKKDNTIMAWEIANEARTMREEAVNCYTEWVGETALLIKSIDKNHLVTTGSEGEIGCENMKTFEAIHAFKNIDYITIHILPKNWGWFDDTSISKNYSKILSNTLTYVSEHIQVANTLNKPLVIEEFALPRDKHSFETKSTTILRNNYYQELFATINESRKGDGIISGCNFWCFGGRGGMVARTDYWWKTGDNYIGDPPQEEQGLNSVYSQDKSTWKIVSAYTRSINKNLPLEKGMNKNSWIAANMNKNLLFARSKGKNSPASSIAKQ